MLAAFIYLRLTSLKNWFLYRARRLRKPKYLVGAIVGVAYVWFFFVHRVGSVRIGQPRGFQPVDPMAVAAPGEWARLALALGAVGVLVIFGLTWIVPTRRAALGFSEAEIAFLFPAPVTRRALVHFRLLSSFLRSLAGALFMALFTNRWTFLGGNALTHALGWWLIFSAISLHYHGATFTLTRLGDRGFNVPLRRVVVLLLLVATITITYQRLPMAERLPRFDHASGSLALSEWAAGVTSTAPLSIMLFPLRLVIAPFLALTSIDFVVALGPALLVIMAEYFWVVRSTVAFEEASIEHAQRRAARIALRQSGERRFSSLPTEARPAPFPLRDGGRPEVAILWKNLLSTWPYFNLRTFSLGVVVIAVGAAIFRRNPEWNQLAATIAGVAAFAAAYVAIIGPQFARQDLRGDLRNLEILKTYPLPGWQIVLGEILTPTAILAGIVWLAFLTAALFTPNRGPFQALEPGLRLAAAGGTAVLLPPLLALQLLIPNAAAVIFPGWFATVKTRGGGIDVMGQRLIFFFAQVVTMVLVLAPAAGVGALFLLTTFLGVPKLIAIGAAVIVAAGVLIFEAAAGIWWLGTRFEKIDLSDEMQA